MRLVFVDLETGGLEPGKHPITQVACVAVDPSLKELASFERKVVFNEADCDPESLAVSRYNREQWQREAVAAPKACAELSAFFKRFADVRMVSQRTGNPYFVAQMAGYNAATFDGPFLQCFYRQQDAFLPAAFRVLDVLQRVLWHFHERPQLAPPSDFKLGTICQHTCRPRI